MITMLYNETFDKYKTIWTKDYPKMCEMFINGKKFKQYDDFETRWKFVSDDDVKSILNDKFSSKGRGKQYQVGLPSGTVISSSLFPVDLKGEIFKLTWLNNEDEDVIRSKEKDNLISLEMGSYVHRILELFITSDIPKKKRKLEEIIEQSREDKEIIKIKDFDQKQIVYETLVLNMLPNFIERQLLQYDVIGSEIFFNTGDIQGSVDLVAIKNGVYYVIDFKTTRRAYKQSGKRKFSSEAEMADYHRQLNIYDKALKDVGYIPRNADTKFQIHQFHLLSQEFKTFNPSNNLIYKWNDGIEKVQEWYWKYKK